VLDRLAELKHRKSEQTLIAVILQKPRGASSRLTLKLNIRALGEDETQVRALLSPYSDIQPARITARAEYQRTGYSEFMYNPGRNERNLSDNIWTDDRNVLVEVIDHCRKVPGESRFITTLYSDRQLYSLRDDACYSARGTHFMSNHLLWDEAGKDAVNTGWYEGLCAILWPRASSYYVNQMEGTRQSVRTQACFSAETWQRLSALRRKYDPAGRFFNHVGHD